MKQVKVGGFIYKIKYPYIFKERGDLAAQADHDELTIRVSATDGNGAPIAREKLAESILHEILNLSEILTVLIMKSKNRIKDEYKAMDKKLTIEKH